MSKLIILGNTNKFTFTNAIVAAQEKSILALNQSINEIYVIHTKESFDILFREEHNWIDFLNTYNITFDMFVNRVINANTNETIDFITYIEEIFKKIKFDSLFIDISNGTSERKTILSIISYILDLKNVFVIDSIALNKAEDTKSFLEKDVIKQYYHPFPNNKKLDKLAYLNLTEITRYGDILEKLSKIYDKINLKHSDNRFFKANLLNAIMLKIKNDNSVVSDNSLYRISSTAISASTEDLIDKLLLDSGTDEKDINGKTLGTKIKMLESKLKDNSSLVFDYEFFQKFNDFIRYLRNSTTHKGLHISDSEKFKAELSLKMSITFLDYYSSIIYNELKMDRLH